VGDSEEAEKLGIDRIPAFVLQGHTRGRVRFFGIPAGYEFGSLIESLFDVSTGKTDLTEKTRSILDDLDQPVHVQVFVTPTCPYCPQAARLAHKMAVENAHVTADVVEISEFPEMGQRYQVSGVPQTVINENIVFTGAVPESRLMRELIEALENAQPAAQHVALTREG
jgi:glutaredoxin-like protein